MAISSADLLLGAHMSIAGGLEQAIIRGDSIQCGAIQIFVKSNRQWRMGPVSDEEVELFKKTLHDARYVRLVIAHASYLINLASITPAVYEQSIRGLAQEIGRCEVLGIPAIVLHPGSGDTHNEKKTLQQVAHGIDKALEKTAGKTMVLLETMAGQGNSIGHTFEQLATIYEFSKSKKHIGICVDTCHLYAAGYDFSHKEVYKKMWHQFNTVLGYDLLKAIHINDSKKGCNSRVDRHEHIGKGKIGLEGFKLLLEDKHFKHIPKILETPKAPVDLEDDKRNMLTLLSLLK